MLQHYLSRKFGRHLPAVRLGGNLGDFVLLRMAALPALPKQHISSTAAESAEWSSILLSRSTRAGLEQIAPPSPSSPAPLPHPALCSHRESEEWGAALQAKDGPTVSCAVCVGSSSVGLQMRDDQGREMLRQYWDTMLAEGAQRGLNSNSSGYRSTAAAIQSCAESIRRLSGGDSASISCIGTAAFRLCAHSESGVDGEARQALQRLCGPFLGLGSVSIQVLTGAEEGTLAFRAATSELASGHCLVIDLGGRSTELAAGNPRSSKPPCILSLPIGCLTTGDPTDMRAGLDLHLDRVQQFIASQPFALDAYQIILAGGTATTAIALLKGLASYDGAAVHGSAVSAQDLLSLAKQLEHRPCNARIGSVLSRDLSCIASDNWLSEARRATMPVGCVALAKILECIGVEDAKVSDRDLLDAILMQL